MILVTLSLLTTLYSILGLRIQQQFVKNGKHTTYNTYRVMQSDVNSFDGLLMSSWRASMGEDNILYQNMRNKYFWISIMKILNSKSD